MARSSLAHNEVELARLQSRNEFAGAPARSLDRDPRLRSGEARENVSHPYAGVATIEAEPHGGVTAPRLQGLDDLVIEREQRAAALHEFFAVRSEFDTAALPA